MTQQKVFTADKIDDYIWLGDIDSSENHEALDGLNITHILNLVLNVLNIKQSHNVNKS